MTGFFVRLQDSKGRLRSVEVERLTNQELANWVLKLDEATAKQWLLSMVRWTRDNVKEKPISEPDEEQVIDDSTF